MGSRNCIRCRAMQIGLDIICIQMSGMSQCRVRGKKWSKISSINQIEKGAQDRSLRKPIWGRDPQRPSRPMYYAEGALPKDSSLFQIRAVCGPCYKQVLSDQFGCCVLLAILSLF